MSLTNVVRRLTASELARQPLPYDVVAYLDGFGQAVGWRSMTYLRPITTAEARSWREGWREGRAADAAWHARQHPTESEESTP